LQIVARSTIDLVRRSKATNELSSDGCGPGEPSRLDKNNRNSAGDNQDDQKNQVDPDDDNDDGHDDHSLSSCLFPTNHDEPRRTPHPSPGPPSIHPSSSLAQSRAVSSRFHRPAVPPVPLQSRVARHSGAPEKLRVEARQANELIVGRRTVRSVLRCHSRRQKNATAPTEASIASTGATNGGSQSH
jgi:hypothetical protein